jgi:DNA-binding response OmpR family regulator
VQDAASKSRDTSTFFGRESGSDFLTQPFQTREKQRRTHSLANRERQEEIEHLSVVEREASDTDPRGHAHPAAAPTLGFDGHPTLGETRHVTTEGAQAHAELGGE